MNLKEKIKLGSVHETLLLPLWGRAVESKKINPIVYDKKAVHIVDNISYDFSKISKNISEVSKQSWIARSIYFDNIYDIEKWDDKIKVLDNMLMFKEYKKNYSFVKKIGMSFSDRLKIMSLTHIKIMQ